MHEIYLITLRSEGAVSGLWPDNRHERARRKEVENA
jgi:hypothetical protein